MTAPRRTPSARRRRWPACRLPRGRGDAPIDRELLRHVPQPAPPTGDAKEKRSMTNSTAPEGGKPSLGDLVHCAGCGGAMRPTGQLYHCPNCPAGPVDERLPLRAVFRVLIGRLSNDATINRAARAIRAITEPRTEALRRRLEAAGNLGLPETPTSRPRPRSATSWPPSRNWRSSPASPTRTTSGGTPPVRQPSLTATPPTKLRNSSTSRWRKSWWTPAPRSSSNRPGGPARTPAHPPAVSRRRTADQNAATRRSTMEP